MSSSTRCVALAINLTAQRIASSIASRLYKEEILCFRKADNGNELVVKPFAKSSGFRIALQENCFNSANLFFRNLKRMGKSFLQLFLCRSRKANFFFGDCCSICWYKNWSRFFKNIKTHQEKLSTKDSALEQWWSFVVIFARIFIFIFHDSWSLSNSWSVK